MQEDQKNPQGNEEKNQPPPPRRNAPPPGASRAMLVWLVLFIGIGALFFFKGYGPSKTVALTQSEFEYLLKNKKIVTAVVVNDGERVMSVTGKLKLDIPADANIPAVKNIEKDPKATGNDKELANYETKLLFSESLANALGNTQVKVESNNSGWWNFFMVGLLPVLLLIGAIYFFSSRQMKSMGKGMDFGKSKARVIQPEDLNIHFADIAGADEAKEEIQEIVEYLKDPLKFQLVGGKIPKGCLLVGEPGTGKTLMAKAVACEAGVPFFAISGSDFVEMFVGVGASRVRDMFEQARKSTPCLIFIDEIDAVGRSRFSGWGGGHDEREQTLNAMLVEMDGLENAQSGVIVLAATNRPDVLDPALLRPGRFDRQVVMDLPDIVGRRKILDVHASKIKVAAGVDLDIVARTTPGFSGAELANLCNEAALLAARNNREAATQSDFEEARDKVCYGRERRSKKMTERERKLTAYHEAGHAIIALFNEYCTPVHKVTIIPRGPYLGATFTMPKEDVYSRSKLELEAEMSMTMGGRVAEEIFLGDVTTGAVGDINQLTYTARRMVSIYGMSDKLGPMKYADYRSYQHVRIDASPEDACSPETAREVDLEVRHLVDTALNEARRVIKLHHDDVDKLAKALLERETMSVEEINVLLGIKQDESAAQSTESQS